MTTYPPDYTSQVDFWDEFQDDLTDIINETTPILVTQATEPTQSVFETAWVSAGNALPVPANQQFLWFDGVRLRGEYMALANDEYAVISLQNSRHVREIYWRNNDDLLVYVNNQPDMRGESLSSQNPFFDADDYFVGVGKMLRDGTIEKIKDFEPYRIGGAGVQGGGTATSLIYYDRLISSYYRPSTDTFYACYQQDSSTNRPNEQYRPTVIGGTVTSPAFGVNVTQNGDRVDVSLYLGNFSPVALNVTVRIQSVTTPADGTNQVVALAANQPMTRVTFSHTAVGNWTTGAQIVLTFSAVLGVGEYVMVSGVRAALRAQLLTSAIANYHFQNESIVAWTKVNVSRTVSTNYAYHVVEYNLTTTATTVRWVDATPFANTSITSMTGFRLFYADGTYYYMVGVALGSTNPRTFDTIYRYNPVTRVVTPIYSGGGEIHGVWYYPTNDKIIINRGQSAVSQYMNTDGTAIVNMTGLYSASCAKGEFIYGLPADYRSAKWPANRSRKAVIWSYAGTAVVDEPGLFPIFDQSRQDFSPYTATLPDTRHRGNIADDFNDYAPLNALLPTYLSQNSDGVYLAAYNRHDYNAYYDQDSINNKLNPMWDEGVYALINEGGSTGKIWRVCDWTEAEPGFTLLDRVTLATDEESVTFTLADYASILSSGNYDNLLLVADSNVIVANDSLTLTFNGAVTNYHYLSSQQAAAVLTKAESISATQIIVPAPFSAISSEYWMWIMDYKATDTYKEVLIQGNRFLALTTTNVQNILGVGGWMSLDAITSIKVATVTAARKLRSGNTFSLYAIKTKDRYNNVSVYSPSMA